MGDTFLSVKLRCQLHSGFFKLWNPNGEPLKYGMKVRLCHQQDLTLMRIYVKLDDICHLSPSKIILFNTYVVFTMCQTLF